MLLPPTTIALNIARRDPHASTTRLSPTRIGRDIYWPGVMGNEILGCPNNQEYEMSHQDKRGSDKEQNTGQQSQDALRHQQDAAHHKVHKSPLPGAADSDAGLQPEIPKVGSRDAPGG